MLSKWNDMFARLRLAPHGQHQIYPAANLGQIEQLENRLGSLTKNLRSMLAEVNGAELFISGLPLVTLFPVTATADLQKIGWPKDWYIDEMTAWWRGNGHTDRSTDWALGIMNYGGLILQERPDEFSEWDTAHAGWIQRHVSMSDWIDSVLTQGKAAIKKH